MKHYRFSNLNKYFQGGFSRKFFLRAKNSAGFTLMEIIVATTIFALVVTALMSMFNYTLKINRRGESLRQATQGMRDQIELIVKEVRNGQIDYGTTNNGSAANNNAFYSNPANPCQPPVVSGGSLPASYGAQDNKLAILNSESNYECFYLAEGPGNADGSGGTAAPTGSRLADAIKNSLGSVSSNPKPVLALQKEVLPLEVLTPPNVSLQRLAFMIRPVCDPYAPNCAVYPPNYPKIQPFVTIMAQFRLLLPTGEQTDVYYQTSVSTNDYNVPN